MNTFRSDLRDGTVNGVDAQIHRIVEQIHASGRRVVLAVTGGGSGAIAQLLRVPGASRTLLEAVVPYHRTALVEFMGAEPEHASSPETAVTIARRALERAESLAASPIRQNGASPPSLLLGVAVTASLVSDRPKRGDHRCHIAVASETGGEVYSIVLEKGRRDRAAEEDLVAQATVLALAKACGVSAPDIAAILGPGDQLTRNSTGCSDLLSQLLAGSIERVTLLPDGQVCWGLPVTSGVLAGSFNPLHDGHLSLAQAAARLVGGPVAFEISVLNVDKPSLTRAELRQRIDQFAWRATVELTRAATFREKCRLLPGTAFIVGVDTAERIIHPKYYESSEANMFAALQEIAAHGCRFLVAGRTDSQGRFRTISDLAIPAQFSNLFTQILEARFRSDLSSTALRAASGRSGNLP